MNVDQTIWNSRYENNETGWDLGEVSPPIKHWLDQQKDKDIKILIPGGGFSYEAEYAFQLGFQHVFVVDLSDRALEAFQKRVPGFPKENLIHSDFFQLEGNFDTIIEQTFFCALPPTMRENYVTHMASLLHPQGQLVGLLFDFPLTEKGPPFGGSMVAYEKLFSQHFDILKMERCYNSAKDRQGNELWIHFSMK